MITKSFLSFLAAAVLAAPVPAQAPAATPAEVAIPNTRHIEFVSKVNGHSYAIDVALPVEPAPAKGYRVIYLLDGNVYFASMVEAVRANGNAPGTVVVGIGYPDTPAWIAGVFARHGPSSPGLAKINPFRAAIGNERRYDMTLPATDAELAAQSVAEARPAVASDVGGLDDFLKVIEVDVKPRVAALTTIDRSEQTLFGHSLGGLAVLQALFTEPEAYRNFVVASPSIWWNNERVLEGEAAFAAKVRAGTIHPRVLVTVGSLEQQLPELPPEMAAQQAKIAAFVTKGRMVDNARDLAARLKALPGQPPYKVATAAVFDDQQHGISVWPAIGRAVSFATGR